MPESITLYPLEDHRDHYVDDHGVVYAKVQSTVDFMGFPAVRICGCWYRLNELSKQEVKECPS